MTKVYRFDIQLPNFSVVIEDDSNIPMSKNEARRTVIDNLQEYIDNEDLTDCVVSEGIELK